MKTFCNLASSGSNSPHHRTTATPQHRTTATPHHRHLSLFKFIVVFVVFLMMSSCQKNEQATNIETKNLAGVEKRNSNCFDDSIEDICPNQTIKLDTLVLDSIPGYPPGCTFTVEYEFVDCQYFGSPNTYSYVIGDFNILSISCQQYNDVSTYQNAPSWCNKFIESYCQHKKKNNAQLSTSDDTLCACLLNNTPSDECLWPNCKEAQGSAWMTPQQYKNQADPQYCYNKCRSMTDSVNQGKAPINSLQYQQVCGEVPLPPSPTDDTSDSGSTFWSSVPMYVWYIVGGVCLLIVFFVIYKLLSSGGSSESRVVRTMVDTSELSDSPSPAAT